MEGMNQKLAAATVLVVLLIMLLFASCTGNAGIESETPIPQGETKAYTYQNFAFELAGVKSERTETMLDDGGNEWQYTVITYYPGAVLTVLKADMSDATNNADGQAHPQWGILVAADPEERIRLVDDMKPLEITPDMAGIYNLEASLYIFRFEPSKE